MCTGGAPKAPDPLPQRQAAKAPDVGSIAARSEDAARRRMGYAATILTPQAMGLAPATVTGKSLLGQ